MERRWHYVYYSYEEWGRGYIGKRSSKVSPDEDRYMGSFRDKTFNPTQKIILGIFNTAEEALENEILLHNFYDVAKNPHFANQAKQKSSGFCWNGSLSKILTPDQERQRRSKISASLNAASKGFFYKLVSPSGSIHVTINFREFCRDHKLNRRNLEKVMKGERQHSRGWTVERMELKQ
jgi:hypothetical protein